MTHFPFSEGFIIAIFGGVTALIAGILTCALKSRCSRIKCGCVECDRIVIPVNDLNNITLNRREPPSEPQVAPNPAG